MRFNLDNGKTEPALPEGAGSAHVRGAQLEVDAHQVVVTAPKGFRVVAWAPKQRTNEDGMVIAEQLEVQADNVRVSVVTFNSGVVRVDIKKTGIPRYLPGSDEESRR